MGQVVAEAALLPPPKLWKAIGTGIGTFTPTMPICARCANSRAVAAARDFEATQRLRDPVSTESGQGHPTDNVDVNKAVDNLNKAVGNVRTAIKNGDNTPDVSPVTDAAGELTKVCTS